MFSTQQQYSYRMLPVSRSGKQTLDWTYPDQRWSKWRMSQVFRFQCLNAVLRHFFVGKNFQKITTLPWHPAMAPDPPPKSQPGPPYSTLQVRIPITLAIWGTIREMVCLLDQHSLTKVLCQYINLKNGKWGKIKNPWWTTQHSFCSTNYDKDR